MPKERRNDLTSHSSDEQANAEIRAEPAKLGLASHHRKPTGLPRPLVVGQIGILLITLGLMLTLAVLLSLNFTQPSGPDSEYARQIIRVIGSALLVAGLVLIGFLTIPYPR